jgi:LmbE family N-acetylglucosaminyl deacetylase
MHDPKEGKLHYAKFALRWKNISELKREKATLVLSPHLDDIFLSLYATLLSGRLGRNIIGVNFFTASDSSVHTKVDTTFSTIARTSIERMREEMNFASLLYSHGINYLPVFLGLKEASIDRYYHFIAGALMGKLSKKAAIKDISLGIYSKMAAEYGSELHVWETLAPLIRHFGSNIKSIVSPMGVGTHLDHGALARSALRSSHKLRFGLYAEIPYMYMSGNMSLEKLKEMAPKEFNRSTVTKFNAEEKARLFKMLYPSQYEIRTKEAILAIGKELGEVVLWNK